MALSIAGSDNSAGAGVQADLKTFGALGVYGLTAITCVVAEVPGKVSAIQAIDPQIVREQIRLSFEAYPVAAMKTGMLYSRAIIESVCDELEVRAGLAVRAGGEVRAGTEVLNLVVDPVMVATSGTALLDAAALEVYTGRLFKLAALVTPNMDEVAVLIGRRIADLSGMREAGAELSERFGTAFLLKGGHLQSGDAIDLLFTGSEVVEFCAPRVPAVKTHGTGCTISAAIAAGLAKGFPLKTAVAEAKGFVTEAIRGHFHWDHGRGTDALNHLFIEAGGDFLLSPAGITSS